MGDKYVCAATKDGVVIADNSTSKMYLFSTSPEGYSVREIITKVSK